MTKQKSILAAGIAWLMLTACHTPQAPLTDTKKMNKHYTETFKLRPCDKVIVEYYAKMSDASDETPPQSIREITEVDQIATIITLAASLPDEGEIMKKMANVPLLRTTFLYPDDTVFFDFYDKSLKTPATSFYATAPKEEAALFELLKK
ncbi:hypothetical protein [Chryseolinea lacunae]|uniref:Lipoprotein n=1 Tax=Chryseolinea lacunae TaxID=2801331 RepID=A0ABS1KJU9_9BACT|nr:hypothetical protein [Chryseolinea lacunae]MBL0739628.1 hypothetical protein [Chryseolinea lacunae]